jgi:hypothetical protein
VYPLLVDGHPRVAVPRVRPGLAAEAAGGRAVTATEQDDALLTLDEALAVFGASYRRLDHWSRLGLIHPEGAYRGSGSQRRWPLAEVRVAARIVELLGAGLTLGAAAHAARHEGRLPGGWRVVRDQVAPDPRQAT